MAARGGFSGLFPYGSLIGIDSMLTSTLNGLVIMYCDLHLSKDAAGFCLPSITLNNSTAISRVYEDGKKTYNVNGKSMTGWFVVDYTSLDLSSNVMCKY